MAGVLDDAKLTDSLVWSQGYARALASGARIFGWGMAELRDERGRLKLEVPFTNLVTRIGNQYYGDRAARILASTSATITACTNAASPVLTATAHGLGVGDIVILSGCTPSLLNGSWVVTAVTANTFTIYVGTAPGATSAFNWTFQGLTEAKATGMRVGTGATAPATTGAGAAIVTYNTGLVQFKVFDATYPLSSLVTDTRRIQYVTTFNAGEATQTGLAEVVITNEQPISDVAGTAANTVSRALLSPTVNKGVSDTLAITWNHDLLGS